MKQKPYSYNQGIAAIAAIIIGLIIVAGIVGIIATQKKAPVSEEPLFVPGEEVVKEDVISEKVAAVCPAVNVSNFVPGGATLGDQLNMDFENDGQDEIAFTFSQSYQGFPTSNFGLRVLQCIQGNWTAGYEIPVSTGSPQGITIESITASIGSTNGLVVIESYEGAGITTEWHIVASLNNQLQKLESNILRDTALNSQGYVFQGYNGVDVHNEIYTSPHYISETVSGYSPSAPRCCPDLPPLEIQYLFTGSAIQVISVGQAV